MTPYTRMRQRLLPPKERLEFVKNFFRVLGYGNKCHKCHNEGMIRKTTDILIIFYCLKCKLSWGFSTKNLEYI